MTHGMAPQYHCHVVGTQPMSVCVYGCSAVKLTFCFTCSQFLFTDNLLPNLCVQLHNTVSLCQWMLDSHMAVRSCFSTPIPPSVCTHGCSVVKLKFCFICCQFLFMDNLLQSGLLHVSNCTTLLVCISGCQLVTWPFAHVSQLPTPVRLC